MKNEFTENTNGESRNFSPITVEDIMKTLELTIKKDDINKVITLLCQISAYTEDSQFNISFNAPSSSGKSYLPLQIAKLFPEEDILELGYCSPTSFFHDAVYDEDMKLFVMDLSRKVIIFLDQPNSMLVQNLRPILSHDKKEILMKITDTTKVHGRRAKNILIKGFPAVIFCSAGLRFDEQEATRFLLLSPEITQEKIRGGLYLKIQQSSNTEAYNAVVNENSRRKALKERIEAIKREKIKDVIVPYTEMISDYFISKDRKLKPRCMRDVTRIISLAKTLALLNVWHREREDGNLIATKEDVTKALWLWDQISVAQEHNLPPYVYEFYTDIILSAFEERSDGLSVTDIATRHFEIREQPISTWKLRKEILQMLETAGLLIKERDSDDGRRWLYRPPEEK